MKPILIATIAAFAAMAAASGALASPPGHSNGRGASSCAPGHGGCGGVNPGHGRDDIRHGGRHNDASRYDGSRYVSGRTGDNDDDTGIILRIGGDGRSGERWVYRDSYGLNRAPLGQEYRVIDGQLVLVDSQTLQIASIIGLLSALVK